MKKIIEDIIRDFKQSLSNGKSEVISSEGNVCMKVTQTVLDSISDTEGPEIPETIIEFFTRLHADHSSTITICGTGSNTLEVIGRGFLRLAKKVRTNEKAFEKLVKNNNK